MTQHGQAPTAPLVSCDKQDIHDWIQLAWKIAEANKENGPKSKRFQAVEDLDGLTVFVRPGFQEQLIL
jgi:hypothetical protein